MSVSNEASTTVAANVRAEVARQRIAQVRIAEALGLPQPSVSKRLRGLTPFSIDELQGLAGLLGVPLSVFLDGISDASEQGEVA